MDPNAVLADLDADQRRAVTTESQLVAVIAGAGSGKTRVLTRRVAYRVATGTADAAHTVVLTFTREAAGELRRRLPRLGLTERVTAGTFHSVAQQLLRQRWIDLDEQPRTIIADRKRLVRDVMGTANLDDLVAELDWASARGVDAAGYDAAVRRGVRRPPVDAQRVTEAMAAYRREKRQRGVVDLDDLLLLTIDALETDADFAAATRWRYRHLLVDEAQDLNPLQHRLVELLRQGVDDLFLVGDPAQAIYSFNGSDPTILREVADRFPGVEVVRLPVNHRCTPQIVDVGARALRIGDQADDIRSARPDGAMVDIVRHDDETAEASWVASSLARLDPTLARTSRVAVLARTHAVLRPVRDALAARGVPVRRLVDGPGSPITPLLVAAARMKDGDLLRRWAHDLREQAENEDDPALEVSAAALAFLRDQPTGDGLAFRTWINTNDPFGRHEPGVELQTFHAAKGREWHTVHLVGCETSLVPHRSATTQTAKAEEARLLYVALTRATDRLTVNWAERRNGYQRKPTPFLDGFVSEAPPLLPPPESLVAMSRSTRSVTLERLHEWRAATARAAGILPDAVCTDRALALIAEHRPASAEELDELTGLGALTSRRLFDRIDSALHEAPATNG
ncbi:ATP-dependent DNA helicase UvrD2 [Ilumatobacter sp.]|uniref:ATP-dependent DNA helicase UvrD2 n=1 Tax=Ilumatobacter sp. TaxID=1967498 RepID=UPI003AF778D8